MPTEESYGKADEETVFVNSVLVEGQGWMLI